MICHQHECIFIHVPKTAGQSVETYFLNMLGLTWDEGDSLLLRYNPDPHRGPIRLDHMTCNEYLEYDYISKELFDKYFKFAFVRNPWARLVSEYRYKKFHKQYSFTDFVLHHIPEPSRKDKYRHIIPQYDFLHDSEGNLTANYVGRYERLQEDFEEICNQLNFSDTILPHINLSKSKNTFFARLRDAIKPYDKPKALSTRLLKLSNRNLEPWHNDYRDYYNSETKKVVGKMYEIDIDTFKYTF